MQIPGHLTVALAQYRLLFYRRRRKEILLPLLLASLFPDVVDKVVGYGFRLMPNGRHYAHNIFGLAGFSTLVTLIWGRAAGLAWFVGYLGHLLADSEGLVPWLFPLRTYPFRQGRLSVDLRQLLKELLWLMVMLLALRRTR
ncbi:MAG: metal-dependent hydrolase [Chloroflexota bacterium]